MFEYEWRETERIKQLLIELEAVNLTLKSLKISPQIEENLRRTSLLKSAVYSARIEGFTDTTSSPKQESQSLIRAYRWIYSTKSPKFLSLSVIKKLHKLIGLTGQWRNEPWAIFNTSGGVVHMAVAHFKLPELMPIYTRYIKNLKKPVGVRSAMAQFIFEKIHPFADGNGRVGRLISAFILEKNGYGFKGLAPFEEYIDKHRDEYYAVLEPSHDTTDFIDFFLTAVITQAKESLEKLMQLPDKIEDELLPRRREILAIIRDHPNCSFDFIARRFVAIKPSLLHYDLGQLIKKCYVKKAGVSRGSVYFAN